MPAFLDFDRGSESRTPPPPDPRYGRFRSFPADYGYNTNSGEGTILGGLGQQWRPYGALLSGTTRGSNNGGAGNFGRVRVGEGGVGIGGQDPDVWEDEYGEECVGGEDAGEDVRWWWERWILSPRRRVVRIIVGSWWKRVGVLMVFPAVVVRMVLGFVRWLLCNANGTRGI